MWRGTRKLSHPPPPFLVPPPFPLPSGQRFIHGIIGRLHAAANFSSTEHSAPSIGPTGGTRAPLEVWDIAPGSDQSHRIYNRCNGEFNVRGSSLRPPPLLRRRRPVDQLKHWQCYYQEKIGIGRLASAINPVRIPARIYGGSRAEFWRFPLNHSGSCNRASSNRGGIIRVSRFRGRVQFNATHSLVTLPEPVWTKNEITGNEERTPPSSLNTLEMKKRISDG